MDKDSLKRLAFLYFEGKSDRSSEKELYDRISTSEQARAEYDALEEEWKAGNIPTVAQRQSFEVMTGRIVARRRMRILRICLSSAAAAIAVLLVVTGIRSGGDTGSRQLYLTTVSTGYGEKTRLILPDSTEVWLHAATTLTYSDSFNREDRKVSLSGEAFFDVTHDEDLPFIVELGGSSITVKGTRFDVAAYSSEEDITAALLEGSIIFRSENAIVDLHPGEVLTYDLKDESILRSQADVDSYAAWINGKLDYPEVTLDKLLDRLSSIYGVDFVYFPEKYREKKFRIILNGDESLSDLLEAISFVAPMEYEMKDGKIYIKER